jgi:AcrR family transcriptional regulator
MRDLPQAVTQLWTRLSRYSEVPAPLWEDLMLRLHGDVPDPIDRNLAVRERLLAAGASLLLDSGRENLNQVLSVQRLSRRAGASRQSWHNQFPDHDFLEALADYAADLTMADQQLDFVEAATDAYIENQPMGVAVPGGTQMLEMIFGLFFSDEKYRVQLLLALMAPDDPAILAPLKERSDRFIASIPRTYERMFRHALLEPRPPHTNTSVAVAMGAMIDGFLLRSIIDPEHATTAHLVDAVVSMLSGALKTVGEDSAAPRGPFDAVAPHLQPEEVEVTTDEIIAGVVQLFAAQGTRRLTLEDLARHLHCNSNVLLGRYGDLSGLALEAWSAAALPDVHLAAQGDGLPTTKIRNVLTALARQSIDNYWLTSAVLRARHDEAERVGAITPDLGIDACVRVLDPLLAGARRATRLGGRGGIGELNDESLHRLSIRLVTQLLLDVVGAGPELRTVPHCTEEVAEQIVADIWDVCLPGLRRPRAATRGQDVRSASIDSTA